MYSVWDRWYYLQHFPLCGSDEWRDIKYLLLLQSKISTLYTQMHSYLQADSEQPV